jgi:hypothetical protein
MTLKTTALLAFIGMALLTLLVAMEFITTFSGVLSDAVAPLKLLSCLIYLFATLALTLFLFVFHKSQP